MNEWGIPNWTEPVAYGDTSKWGDHKWRWEFTRRRNDYRADFDKHLPDTLEQLAERQRREPDKLFLRPDQPGFVAGGYVDLMRKYGLGSLPNPRISDQPFYVLTFRSEGGHFTPGFGKDRWEKNVATASVPDGFGAVVFDLSQPIDRQWQSIREMVLGFQEDKFGNVPARRRHTEKWLSYLRVIDGREAAASWTTIFETVLRESKGHNLNPAQEARGVWNSAKALMYNWPS
jgi:hypothetical protein